MATHIGTKNLQMQDAVSDEATTGLSLTPTTAIDASATGTLPVYDEDGTLLGYLALFDTNTLL